MTSPIPPDWNEQISALPGAHILQTTCWAQIKAGVGWKALPRTWQIESTPGAAKPDAAAMILQRAIPIGGFAARLSVLYVPKGPMLNWADAALRSRVLDDLKAIAKKQHAIFIKIDPDVFLAYGALGAPEAADDPTGQSVRADLLRRGWIPSDEQIQFRNTMLIDLAPAEETLLANMKQKTRYNIRLAERKGVTIRRGSPADFPMLYRLYAETSLRDGFVIRDQGYYQSVWQTFLQAGHADFLLAEAEGETLAAVVLIHFADRAWYMYGMSSEKQREKMPNYLLQWEAMRTLKAGGVRWYDLWGAPDEFNERDSMWGVYRFKEGLGAQVARGLGAWDLPVQPLMYKLYTQTLPRLLDVMRKRGKEKTRQAHNQGGAQ